MSKIAFIIPNQDLFKKVRETLSAIDRKDINLFIGDLYDAVNIAKKLKDVEVIISRGGTAQLLSKELSLPIVNIKVHLMDILVATQKAMKHGEKILFAGFENIFNDVDMIHLLEDLLKVKIERVNFYSIKNKKLLDKWKDFIVVGDTVNVRIAQNYRLKSYLIQSSKEAILEALEKAEEILRVKLAERARYSEIKHIIDQINFGVVYLDRRGIRFINSFAKNVIGNSVNNVIKELEKTGEEEKLFSFGQKKYYISAYKTYVDQSLMGTFYSLREVSEVQKAETFVRRQYHKKGFYAKYTFDDIIGKGLSKIKVIAMKYAATDAPIFIYGESGTGKELFAQSIHNASMRKDGPFVAVNCGSLPKELLESELFGYVEGSFTGALSKGKQGLFEFAHRGTLFLDEIDQIPIESQGKILRAIEEGEILKIGDNKLIPVDVRIIAATNKAPELLIRNNYLRFDLYSRLNVLNLFLPKLSERKGDIEELAWHFLKIFEKKYRKKTKGFAVKTLDEMKSYDWLGNVRELRNSIERAVILISPDREIQPTYIIPQKINIPKASMNLSLIDNIENAIISVLLQTPNISKKEITQVLGISRTYLWKKIKYLNSQDQKHI
ncbi:hypothetical protein DRP43_05655 [candidate division TA06 bacterium]|uniref:Sigma-54 factor interaction domain-containing protein n=1 Tax=candidate division TA06 bacterium TaxID=2250710 RepID=A0A660SC46_UNCT6|nr:MAG: hypothetical protein DRP43_05655 [candidate division TA06 bacterium]